MTTVSIVGTPQTGTFTSGTGRSYTAGAGTNRAVVLVLAHYSSSGGGVPNYTGVQPTYGGVNMTQVGTLKVNSTAPYLVLSMWYILDANIPTGAQTMVASWSDGTNALNEANALATIYTLSGVNQTVPVSATDTGFVSAATSVSGTGLTTTDGGLVIVNSVINPAGNTGVGPAGYTVDFASAFDFSGFTVMAHKAIVTANTETPAVSWTGSSAGIIYTANFQTITVTPTPTNTPTNTPTLTPTISITASITPTTTPTRTVTPTITPTNTVTPTRVYTVTVSERLINLSNIVQPSITGITAIIYGSVPTTGSPNPFLVVQNLSSDTNGYVTFTFGDTGLTLNQSIWVIFMLDGSPAKGSIRKITPTYT